MFRRIHYTAVIIVVTQVSDSELHIYPEEMSFFSCTPVNVVHIRIYVCGTNIRSMQQK